MKKTTIFILFSAMVAAQWIVPASMIYKREQTLAKGAVYRFRCAPVDPYDAFRGRYVALDVEAARFPKYDGQKLYKHQTIYLSIEQDEEGFARVISVSDEKPDKGAYVKGKARWSTLTGGDLRIEFPFDRYYMDEDLALEAERAYRRIAREQEKEAYITVRVRNGYAVLEELYLEDTPIVEYLENKVVEKSS